MSCLTELRYEAERLARVAPGTKEALWAMEDYQRELQALKQEMACNRLEEEQRRRRAANHGQPDPTFFHG